MSHLDAGTLQAFLDDELPPEDRAGVAEHLLDCQECRGVKDGLDRARTTFSEAVAVLDVAAPTRRTSGGSGWGRSARAGSFVKAAGLVLLLATAASAAIPGSPVRNWIVSATGPVEEEVPAVQVGPVEPAPAPAGVSLAAGAAVDIVVTGLDGSALRLIETDGERVAVSAVGADTDPVFETASGRIEVRNAVGGEITIELPRSLESARLLVDGELYAEKSAGELMVHASGLSVEGGSF